MLWWLDVHVNALIAQELSTGPAVLSTAPVMPKQGLRTDLEGMQQNTDAARLLSGAATPLALLTELASATVGDTGGIDQSQGAVSLVTFFCGMKCLPGRTMQGAIGLQDKVTSAEATLFERQSHFGGSIASGRSWLVIGHRRRLIIGRRKGRSKLGGTHRPGFQLMSQFQAEIPDPLVHNLPGFLSASGMRTPTIRILFAIFI